MTEWRSRIIGHGEEDPSQLLAHPNNPRVHPKYQQDVMGAVLDEIGWIDEVIVNQQTGHVINGHLRVALAISKGEPLVPVRYIDLSPEDEAKALAVFDPIGTLAVTDSVALAELLESVDTDSESVQKMLDDLLEGAPDLSSETTGDGEGAGVDQIAVQHLIIVQCRSEAHQAELLGRFEEDGLECRALIS